MFSDPLAGVSAPRLQHTDRFGAVMHLVGHALGGRGAERLLARLGMGISDDTILRRLKRPTATPLAPDVLRVVGVDDWAWQKGQHHYGTILVVLAVRTADAVAAWLAARPSTRIISRDRHGPYAEGVRRGAPQATQVADRFHLVLNLRDAVQQELSRLRRFLFVPHRSPTLVAATPTRSPVIARRRPSVVVDHQHRIAAERRVTP